MTPQFLKWRLSSNFFSLLCFSYQFQLLIGVLCHHYFWIYDNWLLYRIGHKSWNQEKSSVLVFSNIWRLEKVRDTKFWMDIGNEMLQLYPLLRDKGKTNSGSKITPPPPLPSLPPRLRLNTVLTKMVTNLMMSVKRLFCTFLE